MRHESEESEIEIFMHLCIRCACDGRGLSWYGAFEIYHLRMVMVMGVEIDPASARLQRQHTGGVLPAALLGFRLWSAGGNGNGLQCTVRSMYPDRLLRSDKVSIEN